MLDYFSVSVKVILVEKSLRGIQLCKHRLTLPNAIYRGFKPSATRTGIRIMCPKFHEKQRSSNKKQRIIYIYRYVYIE